MEPPSNIEFYDHFFKEKAGVALPMLVQKWIMDIKSAS
jgi:hypothetical protein